MYDLHVELRRAQLNEEFRRAQKLGELRNAARYAWLRWLVLLAAGLFSLMAGQLAGKPFAPAAMWALKTALLLTAAGILGGSVALYAEVSLARQAVKEMKEQLERNLRGTGECEPSDLLYAAPAWWLRASERACYACLIAAVLALMAFVLLV